jgi:DNA-binding MarR family transcriptional regulator
MTSGSELDANVGSKAPFDAYGIRLMDSLTRINRSIRRHAKTTLSLGNLSALATIVEAVRIRPGDLASKEGIAPATLSRIISNLEQSGYISRESDPDDGRSFFLAATAKGTAELVELRQARSAALLDQLRHLADDDRFLLFAAVPALENLAAMVPTQP